MDLARMGKSKVEGDLQSLQPADPQTRRESNCVCATI